MRVVPGPTLAAVFMGRTNARLGAAEDLTAGGSARFWKMDPRCSLSQARSVCPKFRRAWLLGWLLVASLICPAVAAAALQWQAPEQLSAATGGLRLGPDGVGLLFGFPDASGYARLVVRPRGGPSGSPQSLPAGFGYQGSAPVVGWLETDRR